MCAQSCLTLCNLMDCSPSGSSVHGNLQARILEWVTISFSRIFFDLGIKPRSPASHHEQRPSEELQGSLLPRASLVVQSVRSLPAVQETACNVGGLGSIPESGTIPSRRKWQPIAVFFLAWKSQRQRSLVGYTPWGHKRARHNLATKSPPLSKAESRGGQNS